MDNVAQHKNKKYESLVFQQKSHIATIGGYLREGINTFSDFNLAKMYSKDNRTLTRFVGEIICTNTLKPHDEYFYNGLKYSLDTWDFDGKTGVETICIYREDK